MPFVSALDEGVEQNKISDLENNTGFVDHG
jgi:hypothetical protein